MHYNLLNWNYPNRYSNEATTAGYNLDELLIGKGKKILDAACAVGVETARLAASHPGNYFIGMDILESNIAIARRGVWGIPDDLLNKGGGDARKKGIEEVLGHVHATKDNSIFGLHSARELSLRLKKQLPNLAYIVGDIDSMPFAPASFDMVLAFNFGLSYARQWRRESHVMNSLRSLLKPDGYLIY